MFKCQLLIRDNNRQSYVSFYCPQPYPPGWNLYGHLHRFWQGLPHVKINGLNVLHINISDDLKYTLHHDYIIRLRDKLYKFSTYQIIGRKL